VNDMSKSRKMVVQVTIAAEECPELHRRLADITSPRRRVKRFLSLAEMGLFAEHVRLGVAAPAQADVTGPGTSMPLKPLALNRSVSAPQLPSPPGGQSIAEMADMFEDSKGAEGSADADEAG